MPTREEIYNTGLNEFSGIKDYYNPGGTIISTYKATVSDPVDHNWSGAFVNWVFNEYSLTRTGVNSPSAWLSVGSTLTDPLEGCLVITKKCNNLLEDYVGFYTGLEYGNFILLYGSKGTNYLAKTWHNKRNILGLRDL